MAFAAGPATLLVEVVGVSARTEKLRVVSIGKSRGRHGAFVYFTIICRALYIDNSSFSGRVVF